MEEEVVFTIIENTDMDIKFHTNRLQISLISLSDLDKIHVLHSLPETDKFNTLGIPENIDQTEIIIKEWIEKNRSSDNRAFTCKVELLEDKLFIGLISLKLDRPNFRSAEVWYKFHYNYWNRGYATESLNRILTFGFEELKLHRIEAGCAVDNIGSIRALEKVGMVKEGRKRKVLPLKTGWSDTYEYAILDSDFKINMS